MKRAMLMFRPPSAAKPCKRAPSEELAPLPPPALPCATPNCCALLSSGGAVGAMRGR
eukprot:CAMPEP_0115398586 /NCGR_PEP_ID=MMETSP0271-20121206/14394_1 /TAXON_ID=71861 /ORGANISM="Scrippsiella trochoidea, Strain CCMP3099" /LENGTH=56 /DNA_ID=CAMNT_0002822365 /DNA_START=139 /DNA_END=306 /DNA_ORIENTATION=-